MTSSGAPTIIRILGPLLFLLVTAAILFYFPPTHYSFYPECPFHRYLGLLCPGCGTTRALSAILHGHLREALRLNAFTTLLLPVSLFYAAAASIRRVTGHPAQLPCVPHAALYATLVIAALFTITRNLPPH